MPERASTATTLRAIPAVDQLLRHPAVSPLVEQYGQRRLTRVARKVTEKLRKRILAVQAASTESTAALNQDDDHVPADTSSKSLADQLADEVVAAVLSDQREALCHVVNATGILLHTNLGRAPLAAEAQSRMQSAARYCNVELDLGSGRRARRGERTCRLLAELTGTEESLIVNNCAAATLLVLSATSGGREVIISRGQLVEIGGGFRLPDVFTAAGVRLHEVGTTNRTYLSDYRQALNEDTGAILRVHSSNFCQIGFTSEPTIAELAELPRSQDVALIDDLGSGCLYDLQSIGLAEPTVGESVAAKPDLTLFSGDKLFGGPQCGIIVGKRRWIEQCARHPFMRAARIDKMTLAALEATTEIHLAGNAKEQLPLYGMLHASLTELEQRAQNVTKQVVAGLSTRSEPAVSGLRVIDSQAYVGGGTLPEAQLPSKAIEIETVSADRLAARLRSGKPAVLVRICGRRVLLDLRTILPGELELVQQRLIEALGADSLEA